MKCRDIYWRRYKIQETLYIGQWCLPFKVGALGPHTVLPITISCPVVFSWISLMVWNLSPSKVILVLGKARSHRAPNLGYSRAESPGWFDVLLENSAEHVMHEWVHRHDEAASYQLPIAVAFWIIWIVSTEECSSLMQNLMQIHCSTHSVILNAMATQYTCSVNGVYHPHWLVQWSHHYSLMHIPVHSLWLPGYIDVTEIILVILTMAGLFLDKPRVHAYRTLYFL